MEELQRLLPRAPGVGEVLQLLRAEPMTRAQLCAVTGQARSTIAARLDSLLETGLIEQRSERALAMGRPASSFHFRPEAGTVLGIDIGASHVRIAVTDLATHSLAEQHLDLPVDRGPEIVLGTAIEVGRQLLAEVDPATRLAGVGIGVPGPVNHTTGRPSSPPIMPGWDGCDMTGPLQHAFGVPVYVDNDANIMAIGEHAAAWKDTADLLFVKFATGVGLGIILDGHIRRGAQGSSGDIGHVRVPGGPPNPCHCGGTGCLEAVIGAQPLAERLSAQGSPAVTATDIVALVRSGDKAALQVMREAGRTAGEVLAGVVSLLNPSVIAVGGVLAQAHEQLIAGIRETVYAKSLPLATQDLRIVTSVAGARAGIIGAATLVCDQVLSTGAVEALVEGRGALPG
ncbi:MAG: ROK family transcriptional regulator [Propionicimonas sp.]